MTLISKSKPASQFTPTTVQLGSGGGPISSALTASAVPICASGSVWNEVTSTTSAQVAEQRRGADAERVEHRRHRTREIVDAGGAGDGIGAAEAWHVDPVRAKTAGGERRVDVVELARRHRRLVQQGERSPLAEHFEMNLAERAVGIATPRPGMVWRHAGSPAARKLSTARAVPAASSAGWKLAPPTTATGASGKAACARPSVAWK